MGRKDNCFRQVGTFSKIIGWKRGEFESGTGKTAVKNFPRWKIKLFAFLRSHKAPVESVSGPRGDVRERDERSSREGEAAGEKFSRVVLTPVRSLLIFRVAQRREQCPAVPQTSDGLCLTLTCFSYGRRSRNPPRTGTKGSYP